MTEKEMVVLSACMNEIRYQFEDNLFFVRDDLWKYLYNLDRDSYSDTCKIEIFLDGKKQMLTKKQIDDSLFEVIKELQNRVETCITAFNGYMMI